MLNLSCNKVRSLLFSIFDLVCVLENPQVTSVLKECADCSVRGC